MRYNSLFFLFFLVLTPGFSQRTEKPVLHGKHWMAITGKTLGAQAGAMIFNREETRWMLPVPCWELPARCGMC